MFERRLLSERIRLGYAPACDQTPRGINETYVRNFQSLSSLALVKALVRQSLGVPERDALPT
eukprot:scaffold1471_cov413-Prasinococcus_capsulatus_cf.AAC.28